MSEQVTLTLPDSTTYTFSEDVEVREGQSVNPLIDGRGGQLSAIAQNFISETGGSGSPMQALVVSIGAGERTFSVTASIYEDSTDTFGSTSASDSATRKLQELANDLA